MVELGLAFLAGLIGHQVRPTLKRDFEGGWFDIACYVTGALLTLPFVILLRKNIRDTTASYLLAFLGIGSGVTVGHYLKPDRKD